jgi:HK97 family phage prohead protease
MNSTQHHIVSSELRSITGDGIFEGYAATWDTPDLGNETIQRGAFLASLSSRTNKLPILLSHSEPIGVFNIVKEDSRGLFVQGQLNMETQNGRDTFALIKQGAISGLSIAFIPVDSVSARDGSHTITKLNLLEISLVAVPRQPAAQITSVRSLDTSEDLEEQDLACIIAALKKFAA